MGYLNSICSCPNIQARLNDAFLLRQGMATGTFTEPLAFLEFITSPANTDGFLQRQVSPGGGKKRTVELEFKSRLPEAEVSTTITRACVSENQYGDSCEEYSIDPDAGVEQNFKRAISDLQDNCQDNEDWFAEEVARNLNVLDRRVATEVMSDLQTLIGKFGDGDNDLSNADQLKTVATQDANGLFNKKALGEISYSAVNMSYPTAPFIFGWDEIHKYFKYVESGCCAQEGLDMGDIAMRAGLAFASDRRVRDVFGADHFIMLSAGAVQLLTYNQFVGPRGINVIDDESYKQMVIFSPQTGLPYDMTLKNDCGTLHFRMSLALKLVGIPAGLFTAGDNLEGVTFVNEFAISN